MKTLSWSDISEDTDQNYAYSEIINFSHNFEIKAAQRLDLAHLLMAIAVQTMDYEDPWDFKRDLNSDPERARKIRLANFMDFTFEFAGKRLALVQYDDRYLQKKTDQYLLSRKDMRVLQSFAGTNSLEQADLEQMLKALEDMKDSLLMQGVDRLSLSKAFVDASFVFAKMCPLDEYIAYCDYISAALNPEPLEESGADESEIMSDMALMAMPGASASVH
ncbi:MAG: hypothetical protein ACLFR0_05945 [Alphaproteobacteria bacterium]